MQRVVILGCSGSGKSTFARAIGETLGLPVVHLDALFWRPDWVEPDREAFRTALAAALEGDAWIADGNYVSTLDLRLPRADTVIYLDQPRRTCLWRIFKRAWTDRGKRRADLAEGCFENITWDFTMWVWTFEKKSRPRIEQAVAAFGKAMITLKGDREAAKFLAELGAPLSLTGGAEEVG